MENEQPFFEKEMSGQGALVPQQGFIQSKPQNLLFPDNKPTSEMEVAIELEKSKIKAQMQMMAFQNEEFTNNMIAFTRAQTEMQADAAIMKMAFLTQTPCKIIRK